jgi:hypothetical protein
MSAKHCVFRIQFFRLAAEVERITFSVSFIRLQEAGVYVFILSFKLKFCENGAFISNSEYIDMYCVVYREACGSAPRAQKISVRFLLVG